MSSPEPHHDDDDVDASVEFALQCVLAARLELDEVAAGDAEALRLLTAALDRATEKLYDARRRRRAAEQGALAPSSNTI